VRQRFFSNEAGLRRCCRDLLYIAEPVVLVVATHARAEGISVDGQTVPLPPVLEVLRDVGNLRALHFSACLLMQDPAVVKLLGEFSKETGAAVSGYRTSVDWAASAIIEFTLLEMVLTRGLTPAAAAGQMKKLLPFAGDREVAGAAFRAA